MPWIRPPAFPPMAGVIDPSPVLAPDFAPFAGHERWRAGWTHIVSGSFSDSTFSGLLCYDQAQGSAAFFETDGVGNVRLLAEHDDWRTSWTHIAVGKFAGGLYSGLLLYDQGAGFGAFYASDGQGGITLLREDDTWRTTWSNVVAGRFSASEFDGVLLYDRSAGFGAFYWTDGHGRIGVLREFDDWRTTWTDIVPGEWYEKGGVAPPYFTDLFFYEGGTGYGETYGCTGTGGILQVGGQGGFPVGARVMSGSFGGLYWIPWTNLLFVDEGLTRGQFWAANGDPAANFDPADPNADPDPHAYTWVPNESIDLGRSYNAVVPGNFWVADSEDVKFDDGGFTDLAFYASADGALDFFLKEPPPAPLDKLAGYASASSVVPGEPISFQVSSNVGWFGIDVYRLGLEERPVTTLMLAPVAPGPHPIARNAWRDGAGWPAAATLRVPATWPSGLYVARVMAGSLTVGTGSVLEAAIARSSRRAAVMGNPVTLDIPFVVRSSSPGSSSSILVGVPDTTYEAYNYWGGRGFYTGSAGGGAVWVSPYSTLHAPRAFRVSFRRGFGGSADPRMDAGGKWKIYEVPFLAWLERHGIEVDVCAASDLHRDPDLLQGYQLYVSIGHDEYWSREMRENVERFINSGGNVAFLSGNTCYWQVRFEDGGDTMVCYKDDTLDPVGQHDPSCTVKWADPPVSDSERKLTGVSGRPAGPERSGVDPRLHRQGREPLGVRRHGSWQRQRVWALRASRRPDPDRARV